MADDQATLGAFAGEHGDGDDVGSADDGAGPDDAAEPNHAGSGETDVDAEGDEALPAGDDDRVCPWCLAGADRFVETGPTGLACGRCSGALPVGADWFDARETVARRPMYESDG